MQRFSSLTFNFPDQVSAEKVFNLTLSNRFGIQERVRDRLCTIRK